MTESYGGAWTRQYGLAYQGAFETWKRGLGDFTALEIDNGYLGSLERESDFPPNLAAFRKLCKAPRSHQENAAVYQAPECLRLPKPRPSYDQARPYLQALRSALKGEAKPS